jgi:hypothetical protein
MREAFRPCLVAVLAALAALGSAACASPETTTTRLSSAELTPRTNLRSVLVVGLSPGGIERRQLEDKLSEGLATRGLVARRSYELFPDAVPTHEAARDAALGAGLDGLLTARVRLVETRRRYVPPTETYFWGFENPTYTRSTPGYYVEDDVAELDTSLWGTKDETKLWAATTRTVNPSSTLGFAGSLAADVLAEMQKAGVVPRER